MIQIITIANPFEAHKHTTEEVYCNGGNVLAYVDCEHYDIILNGAYVEHPETTIPQDGEQLIILPHVGGKGVKQILGIAAMVGLSLFAGSIAGGLWAKAGSFFAKGALGAMLASGAVMFLGGKIINAIFPQQNPSFSYNEQETSQSYGWDLPTPTQIAGGIVGETYGECIPAPQLLEQHVETINDEQYLNLLYCGGYGPIDSISDVRIDYTSIDNFTGVQMETRLGTNDQKPITFFKNTPLDQSVGIEVPDDTPVIRTSDSTKATALEITLEWPGGLFYIDDGNNYANATVKLKLEYRKTGTQGWHNFNKENADYVYEVTAGTNSAVRKAFLVDGLEAGQYDVRLTNVDRPKTTRYQSMYQWTRLTSYLDGIYARPGKVLVALRIKATNQLSGGVPSLNWRQMRKSVWVWEPDSSTYVAKDADNPIWAAYDILHGCKRLKNINTGEFEFVASGVPKEALSPYFDEWKEAAEYADELITNQDGEKEPRFRFDAFFDTSQKRMTAAQRAATVGHAAIIPHGRNYGIVVDKPGAITQIFGEGRTTVSSVKGSFSSKEDRARAIEITYNDSQNDFTNTVLTVRSPNYNKDEGTDNTTQLTLFGVKRRSQAYREAITALATNERQLQFIELSADVDAIVAEYGDIVGYSHAVSRIGIASGRIVKATATTITLDKDVVLEAGKSYEIYIQRANDTLMKLSVASKNYEGRELTLTTALEAGAIPEQYDNYAFGESQKAVKPFRIISASRDGDLLVSLKLAEYDEAMYATELDYSKYPVIDYTAKPTLDEVKEITAHEQTVKQTYTGISNIICNWTMKGKGTEPDSFRVFLKSQTSAYSDIKSVRGTTCTFTNVNHGETYDITVYGVFDAVLYGPAHTSIYVKGTTVATQAASAFHAVISAGGFTLFWDLAKDMKVVAYRLSVDGKTIGGHITANQMYWPCRKSGTYTFSLAQLDVDGNTVGTALTTEATLVLPSPVTNLAASHTYRRYQDGQTGYDVRVTYALPDDANTAEVSYKTNHTDMTELGTIPEGVSGDEIGFSGPWKYAGNGENEVIISGAKIGDKYRIRVQSKNALGVLCAEEDAAYVDETVTAKTEVPNQPQNFRKNFTAEGFEVLWSDVTNTDVDFYEIRTNRNVGAAKGLLARVTGTRAMLTLTRRKGTIYCFAHNTNGQYGKPAVLKYEYAMLDAPTGLTATQAPRAVTITWDPMPAGALGTRLFIKGRSLDTMVDVGATSTYTLAAPADIYDVSACYYDLFGEGARSQAIQATIEPYFDPAWIEDGSVSIAKVDEVLKGAVADAQQSVIDIKELNEKSKELNEKSDGIIGELNKAPDQSGYKSINELVKKDTELSSTIATAKTDQGKINEAHWTKITQNDTSISTIVGNLNKDADGNTYKSLSGLSQKADSISATVASNKNATDTAISKVDQKADSISTTVQDYKTSNDKTVSGLSSKVTQNANSITSIVTNLGKKPSESGYSAITQLQDAVNLRVQKGDVINQINLTPQGTTIDGKYLHVTGSTQFDDNVIVEGMIKSGAITAGKIATNAIESKKIKAGAVTADKLSVSSLSAITATIGTLQTATTGARTVIKDNLIEVYDANNVLRVRLGVW